MRIEISGMRAEGKSVLAKLLYQFLLSAGCNVRSPIEWGGNIDNPGKRFLKQWYEDNDRIRVEDLDPRDIEIVVDNSNQTRFHR